jgi:hypothetical protein
MATAGSAREVLAAVQRNDWTAGEPQGMKRPAFTGGSAKRERSSEE